MSTLYNTNICGNLFVKENIVAKKNIKLSGNLLSSGYVESTEYRLIDSTNSPSISYSDDTMNFFTAVGYKWKFITDENVGILFDSDTGTGYTTIADLSGQFKLQFKDADVPNGITLGELANAANNSGSGSKIILLNAVSGNPNRYTFVNMDDVNQLNNSKFSAFYLSSSSISGCSGTSGTLESYRCATGLIFIDPMDGCSGGARGHMIAFLNDTSSSQGTLLTCQIRFYMLRASSVTSNYIEIESFALRN